MSATGIDQPFPIQTATLPDALAGRDVLGRGRTGSGKTLAFVLPMLSRLAASTSRRTSKRPRALVLAPTRELASQIHATLAPLATAMGMRSATVFGGVGAQPQIAALRNGLDIVVACPGRLEEHLRDGHVRLDAIEITVLDEADHMCDLGFLPVVRRLLDATPARGQRMLFSATLDANVEVLVRRFLHQPVTHSVDPESSPVAEMTHHVLHLQGASRIPILVELTRLSPRSIVFTRTKHKAKTLARQLSASGINAVELHGNLAQNARVRNLAAFSDGSASTLVATDIAARGIHVDDVALVIHADPPEEHKAYLHRSGRTARAGASGTVVTLMTDEQQSDVRDLAKKAGISPTVTKVAPLHPLLGQLARGEASEGGTAMTEPFEPGAGTRPAFRSDRPALRSDRPAARRSSGSGAPGGGATRKANQQARAGGAPKPTGSSANGSPKPAGGSRPSGAQGHGAPKANAAAKAAANGTTATPAPTRAGGPSRSQRHRGRKS